MSLNLIPFRRNHNNNTNLNPIFDDDFFRPFFGMDDVFSPNGFRVELREKKDHYELIAELPGVNREDIDITCDKGFLTITANVNAESKKESEGCLYTERRSGSMRRSFNLDGIREDQITARCNNGILTVTLPKLEENETASRRIAIGE